MKSSSRPREEQSGELKVLNSSSDAESLLNPLKIDWGVSLVQVLILIGEKIVYS